MELDISSIDQAGRQRVAKAWSWKMGQEFIAVARFSRFTIELSEVGCSAIVLEACAQAAADEARHATACGQIARAMVGDTVQPGLRGSFLPEAWPGRTREESLAIMLAETCCVSETLSIAMFVRMLETVRDPTLREVIGGLLADEIRHGGLGFMYLAELRAGGDALDHVKHELVEIVRRHVAEIFEATGFDDPALEVFGYLGPKATQAVYRKGLAELVLPGFDNVGIDTSAARRTLAERGWLT